jgi:hypothetical protein
MKKVLIWELTAQIPWKYGFSISKKTEFHVWPELRSAKEAGVTGLTLLPRSHIRRPMSHGPGDQRHLPEGVPGEDAMQTLIASVGSVGDQGA